MQNHPSFGPILHVNGPPGRIYTDTVCLVALLLYQENNRTTRQQQKVEHCEPEELFLDEDFTQFIEHKLIGHHHHNPELATLVSELEFNTLIILPSPSIAFEHVMTLSKGTDSTIKAKSIGFYRDWLSAVRSFRKNATAQVISSKQACEEPISVARALLRLKMITRQISATEFSEMHQIAKRMTPFMSRSKYGRGYSEFEETRCHGADKQAILAFLAEFPEGPNLIAQYEELMMPTNTMRSLGCDEN